MPKRALTAEEERQLVADYQDPNTKVLDIVDKFGIARQTLYDILDRHGVRPGRQAPASYPEGITTLADAYEWAMSKVLEQERTIGRLEALLERKELLIEELLQRRLLIDGPNAGPHGAAPNGWR
jgi:transposase-like protein